MFLLYNSQICFLEETEKMRGLWREVVSSLTYPRNVLFNVTP